MSTEKNIENKFLDKKLKTIREIIKIPRTVFWHIIDFKNMPVISSGMINNRYTGPQ